jgi:hypothetical protein
MYISSYKFVGLGSNLGFRGYGQGVALGAWEGEWFI